MSNLAEVGNSKYRRIIPYAVIFVPSVLLTVFFLIPTIAHLSTSFYKSEGGVVTDTLTLSNYTYAFSSNYVLNVMIRTFIIGAVTSFFVVLLGFPLAYFLSRTTSRHKSLFFALCFAPLLSSVTIRTYGWYTVLSPTGVLNKFLLWIGAITQPVEFLPSTFAVIIGLTHVLLPYGTLTLLSSLQGINPNLERAAMDLGANRTITFLKVILPLAMPGLLAGYCLAFAITLSAYATPVILGGPRTETMATMIYTYMNSTFDWSMSATLGVLLIVASLLLLFAASKASARKVAS